MTVSRRMPRCRVLCLAVLALAVSRPVGAQAPVVTAGDRARFTELASRLDEQRIRAYVEELASLGSRVTGYPGCDQAAIYLREQLERIGVSDVHYQDFDLAVPVDEDADVERQGGGDSGRQFATDLEILNSDGEPVGAPIRVRPLWPNLVRTSQLPPAGLAGQLVYGGHSTLGDYDGKAIEHGIALVEFNCGGEWFNAPRLGAQAVIFIEPNETVRGEVEAKFSSIPVDMPRFWIARRDADLLLTRLETSPDLQIRLRCRMPWSHRPARNIIASIPGTSPQLAGQTVLIESFYDSISIVPSLAPGAESALGVAVMLELARLLVANPPARSVRLLLTAGHFQGLLGSRYYLEKNFAALSDGSDNIALYSSLDIASKTQGVGLFYKGNFINQKEQVRQKFADLGRVVRERAEVIAEALGESPEKSFADGINPVQGKTWSNFIPGKAAFGSEFFTSADGLGVSFSTIDDARPLVDTPFDVPDNVDFDNVMKQARFLACLYDVILNEEAVPLPDRTQLKRIHGQGGFATVAGRVAQFDPRESFIPDEPVEQSLAVIRTPSKSYMGVRGNFIEMVSGADATFNFYGIPPSSSGWSSAAGKVSVEAYKLDAQSGQIRFAPDRGTNGAAAYPIDIALDIPKRELTVVVFECVSTAMYELVDPQSMEVLKTINVYDGRTDSEPQVFGYALVKPEPWQSHVETTAVVFARPQSRFKVVMGAGLAAKRFVLLNSYATAASVPNDNHFPKVAEDREAAEGFGYEVLAQGVYLPADKLGTKEPRISRAIYYTPYIVATDMWNLNEFRIKRLEKYKIINEKLNDLHTRAGELLGLTTTPTSGDNAKKALNELRYQDFAALARAAHGYESRAYPDVQKTADDVVKGVVFYLALLIPFAFFAERLLFARPQINDQVRDFCLIFIGVFLIFSWVHPAFKITMNPVIILLAFVMMALSILVMYIIVAKFEEQLKALQRQMGGTHSADIGRMGVAQAAFNLGISNMRRRPVRTLLTSATLVLLTFTVLSFTSVVSRMKFNTVKAPGKPRYQGIMVRSAIWKPLEEQAYRLIKDEFGANNAVAGRVWFYTSELGEQSFVNITCNKSNADYDAKALCGLTPDESRVSRIDACLEPGGRWFNDTDRYVCVLPEGIADAFNLDEKDFGSTKVRVNGLEFDLIGILNNAKLKKLEDLDSEMLTPVDFIMMQQMQGQQGGGGGGSSGGDAEQGFQEYLHLTPDATVFVPFETLLNMGGTLRSVATDFQEPQMVASKLAELMPRLGFNLYAGQGEEIVRYSSVSATSVSGFADLLIPIAIAALIVLNTMLGAVYERFQEIGIFSSIGLAPSHVAILFLAEALVYSIIGAILGYLAGQILAVVLAKTNMLTGLSLNYSSLAAIWSTFIVIAVVFLSTLYPAKKAGEVATPGVERRWTVPDPDGDLWTVPLPFSVTGKQAVAMNKFMAEWFNAYEEYSIGDFVTENTQLQEKRNEYGLGYEISLMAWLAPFDLGVSQHVTLRTIPIDMKDVYEIDLLLRRESGDVSSWMRVNRRFLNTLRKQFLIWRTIGAEEKELYMLEEEDRVVERKRLMSGGAPKAEPEPGAVPPPAGEMGADDE